MTALVIEQGKTFQQIVRWESDTVSFKPITGVSQSAPAIVTAVSHGLPSGWRAAVVSVKGMTEINALNDPPKDRELYTVSSLSNNTLSLVGVNSSGWHAYTSGGYLRYNEPVDLNGYTARMQIRTKIGGTLLASTETADAPLDIITVTIDNAAKLITVSITAAHTAGLIWKKGVYDLEMVSAGGVVSRLLSGSVSVTPEVTT